MNITFQNFKFKTAFLFLSASALIFTSCNNGNKEVALTTKEDTLSYAIGMTIGQNINSSFEQDGLDTVVNVDKLLAAFKAAFDTGDVELLITQEEANEFLQAYQMEQQDKQLAENKKKFEGNISQGESFLAVNAKKAGVITTPSGLQYEILKKGSGAIPTAESTIKFAYHGTFLDGTVFDSSIDRKEPVTFPVNRLMQGWQEALLMMPSGSKWKLYVPYQLAYGAEGYPPKIPPYSTLIFEMELLGIEK